MCKKSAFNIVIIMTLASCANQGRLPVQDNSTPNEKSIALVASVPPDSPDPMSLSCIQIRRTGCSSPEDGETHVRWARKYFELGDYGQAIVFADEALKRVPDNIDALSIMAVSALRVSKYAMDSIKPVLPRKRGRVSESKAIAELLRAVIGEQKLVPDARKDLTR